MSAGKRAGRFVLNWIALPFIRLVGFIISPSPFGTTGPVGGWSVPPAPSDPVPTDVAIQRERRTIEGEL